MKDRHVFFDTNILVYAHDKDAGEKGLRARKIIEAAWKSPYPPAISVQVLQEFFVNLSKRGIARGSAVKAVRNYYQWEVIPNNVELFESGLEIQERWKLSFWDSLVVAAAQRSKADVLFTEDLQHGQKFDSLVVENPLRA